MNTTASEKYINLLKHVLIDLHRIDMGEFTPVHKTTLQGKKKVWGFLNKFTRRYKVALCHERRFSYEQRELGLDWPTNADSMIGLKRMQNIQDCVTDVIKNNVEGDLIETGVWRGGATIFMRAILAAYDVKDRKVWVADSFEGLPTPDEDKYKHDKGDTHYVFHKELAVSIDDVKRNFAKYDLLDEQVQFLKGWFKDTLPHAPIEKLAVLRLDGDMYESTMDALNSLYHKVTPGGYVIVDDWGAVAACKQAILDFRAAHNITDEIIPIDTLGVYWKKTK